MNYLKFFISIFLVLSCKTHKTRNDQDLFSAQISQESIDKKSLLVLMKEETNLPGLSSEDLLNRVKHQNVQVFLSKQFVENFEEGIFAKILNEETLQQEYELRRVFISLDTFDLHLDYQTPSFILDENIATELGFPKAIKEGSIKIIEYENSSQLSLFGSFWEYIQSFWAKDARSSPLIEEVGHNAAKPRFQWHHIQENLGNDQNVSLIHPNPHAQTILILESAFDPSGAFRSPPSMENLKQLFDAYSADYNIIFIKVHNEQEIFQAIREAPNTIRNLTIRAHGKPDSIILEQSAQGNRLLSINSQIPKDLASKFDKDSHIVLCSCSTGGISIGSNLAEHLSHNLDVRTYAPSSSASVGRLDMLPDEHGDFYYADLKKTRIVLAGGAGATLLNVLVNLGLRQEIGSFLVAQTFIVFTFVKSLHSYPIKLLYQVKFSSKISSSTDRLREFLKLKESTPLANSFLFPDKRVINAIRQTKTHALYFKTFLPDFKVLKSALSASIDEETQDSIVKILVFIDFKNLPHFTENLPDIENLHLSSNSNIPISEIHFLKLENLNDLKKLYIDIPIDLRNPSLITSQTRQNLSHSKVESLVCEHPSFIDIFSYGRERPVDLSLYFPRLKEFSAFGATWEHMFQKDRKYLHAGVQRVEMENIDIRVVLENIERIEEWFPNLESIHIHALDSFNEQILESLSKKFEVTVDCSVVILRKK